MESKKQIKGPIQLLVIECQPQLNWYEIFSNATFQGQPIKVEQAEWDDISPVSYGSSAGCVVTIRAQKNPLPNTSQNLQRTIQVDFLLVRSVTRGISNQDSRNLLYAFVHSNIPSVNSLQSILMTQERPVVFGALRAIQRKLGRENFPLIEQDYYPNHKAVVVTPDLPLVAKVGHAHAGYGKVKLKSAEEVQDFKSLTALHDDYLTAEPFIEWDFDMRIQKIGNHYRAFQRKSPNWKGNVGNMSILEDLEMNERYKLWIDECSKIFGGLDICALDLLHSKKTGKEVILELNDTAIGLVHKYEQEDMMFMRDVVLARMDQAFGVEEEPQKKDNDISSLQEEIKLLKVQLNREQQEKKELSEKLEELKDKKKKKKGIFS